MNIKKKYQADFIKGFNAGYLLRKDSPELYRLIANRQASPKASEKQVIYMEGFELGGFEYETETSTALEKGNEAENATYPQTKSSISKKDT